MGRRRSLWTGTDEANWLGWLDIVDEQLERRRRSSQAFADDVKEAGFKRRAAARHGRLEPRPRGAGETFGRQPGFPELHVLDSTDPGADRSASRTRIDLDETLFIVSSKSGTTLEPNIFKALFLRAGRSRRVGASRGGQALRRDHRSRLDAREDGAERDGFRHIFHGVPRSAAATRRCRTSAWCRRRRSGSTSQQFLDATARDGALLRAERRRRRRTRASSSARSWACCQRQGRDKVTIVASPGIADLGAWLEQLLAESTGKMARASSRSTASRSARRRSTATTACSPTCGSTADPDAEQDAGGRGARSGRAAGRAHRRATTRCSSARNSSAGRSRPRSPARSSASTRSTSPTSRPARSRRAS